MGRSRVHGRSGGGPAATPDQLWRKGRAAFARGRCEAALQAWARCEEPKALAARAEAHLRLALAATEPQEAIASMRAAVRLAPHEARHHYHLGLALWRHGDLADAQAALDRSVELDPRERRFRRLARLLAASRGYGPALAGDGWRAAWLLAARDGSLPPRLADAPAWAGQVLDALAALDAGDAAAIAAILARRADGPRLPAAPAAVEEALRWSALRGAAAAAHWDAILSAPAGEGGARMRQEGSLRRTAAAQRLVECLGAGDAAAAEAAWSVLDAGSGMPTAVRDRVALGLGQAWARCGNWAEAARHWQAVGGRYALDQPLALAREQLGDRASAARLWDRVAAAVRRGQWTAAGKLSSGRLLSAIERHAAALARQQDNLLEERRRLAAALAHHPDPPVALTLEAARACGRLRPGTGPQWERGIELCSAVVAQDPDCVEAWEELARVLRWSGRHAEAVAAGQRWLGLDSGNPVRRDALLEDSGRAVFAALMAGDAAEIERLARDVAAMPQGPDAHGRWPALLALLAASVALRLRGARRMAAALTPWEPFFRQGPAGHSAPVAAFALRGVLYAVSGSPRKAELLFFQVMESPVWARDRADGVIDQPGRIRYQEWFGWSLLWAERLRQRRPETLEDVGPDAPFWRWLALTTLARGPLDGAGGLPQPPQIPALLAGGGRLEEVYRSTLKLQSSRMKAVMDLQMRGIGETDAQDDGDFDPDADADADADADNGPSPSAQGEMPFFTRRPGHWRRKGARL